MSRILVTVVRLFRAFAFDLFTSLTPCVSYPILSDICPSCIYLYSQPSYLIVDSSNPITYDHRRACCFQIGSIIRLGDSAAARQRFASPRPRLLYLLVFRAEPTHRHTLTPTHTTVTPIHSYTHSFTHAFLLRTPPPRLWQQIRTTPSSPARRIRVSRANIRPSPYLPRKQITNKQSLA